MFQVNMSLIHNSSVATIGDTQRPEGSRLANETKAPASGQPTLNNRKFAGAQIRDGESRMQVVYTLARMKGRRGGHRKKPGRDDRKSSQPGLPFWAAQAEGEAPETGPVQGRMRPFSTLRCLDYLIITSLPVAEKLTSPSPAFGPLP